MTAPNSKVREFHVERVCDVYKRYNNGLFDVEAEVGSFLSDSEELFVLVEFAVGEPIEGNDSLLMVVYDVLWDGRPAPWKKKKAWRTQRRRTC
jgi:hypothetical protein